MIFVATGTHHQPFERLVRATDALARDVDEPVVLQRGPALSPTPHCVSSAYLSSPQFERYLLEARVVVLHAGSSSFLQARALGRRPILVPRRPEHGEHVDRHQLDFAAGVAHLACVIEPSQLSSAVRSHRDAPHAADPGARSRQFGARLEASVAALLDLRR